MKITLTTICLLSMALGLAIRSNNAALIALTGLVWVWACIGYIRSG